MLRHPALRGKVSRIALTALRNAKKPLTTAEIAQRVMAERGLNTANERLVKLMGKRTGACLRDQRARGLVRSQPGPEDFSPGRQLRVDYFCRLLKHPCMKLARCGIDVFYIDESERFPLFVLTAVRVPFLREVDGHWQFVWEQFHNDAVTWRRNLSRQHSLRFREELHGYRLLRCQGRYHRTWRNLSPEEAQSAYASALETLTFLPQRSIISTFATNDSVLTGHKRITAALFALFQRLRKQCRGEAVNGMIFFDEGHTEYVRHFRQAQRYLPTGSAHGAWEGGKLTKNLPLSMFPKDGNFKRSDLSYFLQIADLVVYAARLKLERELNILSAKRVRRGHHTVYDALPREVINVRATRRREDGIVPT